MALDSDRLANNIVEANDAAGLYDTAIDPEAAKSDSLAKIKIMCAEIVAELTNNANVSTVEDSTTPVTVDPNTGDGATDIAQTSSGGVS